MKPGSFLLLASLTASCSALAVRYKPTGVFKREEAAPHGEPTAAIHSGAGSASAPTPHPSSSKTYWWQTATLPAGCYSEVNPEAGDGSEDDKGPIGVGNEDCQLFPEDKELAMPLNEYMSEKLHEEHEKEAAAQESEAEEGQSEAEEGHGETSGSMRLHVHGGMALAFLMGIGCL